MTDTQKEIEQALKEYLRREMPAGTIIGDPDWWAAKITRAISLTQGVVYLNPNLEFMAEEAECVSKCLDDRGVPKEDDGKSLSLWGRVAQYKDGGWRDAEAHLRCPRCGNDQKVKITTVRVGTLHPPTPKPDARNVVEQMVGALEEIESMEGSENDEWDGVERVIPEMAATAKTAREAGQQWLEYAYAGMPTPYLKSVKVPGMAVQALAGEIIQALLADEKDGGYDLTAGRFGPKFSTLVRRLAAAEWYTINGVMPERNGNETFRFY